jgi:hypothetical protein
VGEAVNLAVAFAVDRDHGFLRERELLDYVIDEVQGQPSLASNTT